MIVENADLLVVLVTVESNFSEHVYAEFELARRHNRPIIPVQVEDAKVPPDRLTYTTQYFDDAGRGCYVELIYNIERWASFWINLDDLKLDSYSFLTFDVRTENPETLMQLKIELHFDKSDQVALAYVSTITEDWQTVCINLQDFINWQSDAKANQISFVFEVSNAGHDGIMHMDNVTLWK